MEILLRKETRKPYVLSLLRLLLKGSNKQADIVIKDYLVSTIVYAFKK